MAGELRPLTHRDHRRVRRVVHRTELETGLQVCVYVGDAGHADARDHAEQLFHAAGLGAHPAVLLLVAPDQRRVEVLTSPAAHARVDHFASRVVVADMTARFAAGDLAGGIIAGVERIRAAAGPGPRPTDAEELPDLLEG